MSTPAAATALVIVIALGILAITQIATRRPQKLATSGTPAPPTGDRDSRNARCHAEIDRLVETFLHDGRRVQPQHLPARIKASFPPPAHREWRHLNINSRTGWIYRDLTPTFVLAIGNDRDWAFVGTYFYRSAGKEQPESWPVSKSQGFQDINDYELGHVAGGYVNPEQVVQCFRDAIRAFSKE
ncbi:hypothetical protein [Micromonospora sp. NPDC004704]